MHYRDGFLDYYMVTILYVIPAIILGTMCEKCIEYVQQTYNLTPVVAFILHVLLLITILYIVEIHISTTFGENWQAITPGIFFVSIFFDLQVSLYKNMDKIILQ